MELKLINRQYIDVKTRIELINIVVCLYVF